MSKTNLFTTLMIRDINLTLHLGWSNQERKRQQNVGLDLKIAYPIVPRACLTDNLNDTVCYDKLIEKIRKKITVKPYRLVEHLAAEIYSLIKNDFPKKTKLTVSITKYPNIKGLNGGVCFHYGDEK